MGRFGTAAEIAKDRTVLRFYRPFLEATLVTDSVATMCGSSVAHLKFRLGLLTSRFRANHPLKICSSCMRRDVELHGWAYWHLAHQFPGVWMCPEHREPLQEATLKSTGVERFQWHLPSVASLRTPFNFYSKDLEPGAFKLATLVLALVASREEDGWLNPLRIQAAVRIRMKEMGWLLPSGRNRLDQAAESFLNHAQPLQNIPELGSLPIDREAARNQLGRLLRPMRTGTHPLRWLIVLAWLFDDVEDFIETMAAAEVDHCVPHSELPVALSEVHSSGVRPQVLVRIREGSSASAVAREYGLDVVTVMAWAASEGISVRRRPKKLTPSTLTVLHQQLRDGDEKDSLARQHNVSIETITRLLRTEVGLHAQWAKARQDRARQNARGNWLSVMSMGERLGVKWMHSMQPAAYAWLYRNDMVWLQANRPSTHVARSSGGGGSVRWDERDVQLSVRIQQTALALSQNGSRKLRLWQLYQALPELKSKLGQLDRLPLTRKALDAVLAHRSRAPLSLGLF